MRVCISTVFYVQTVAVSERNKVLYSNQTQLYRLFIRGVPYAPVYTRASEISISNVKFDIVIIQDSGILVTEALNRHCFCNNF